MRCKVKWVPSSNTPREVNKSLVVVRKGLFLKLFVRYEHAGAGSSVLITWVTIETHVLIFLLLTKEEIKSVEQNERDV